VADAVLDPTARTALALMMIQLARRLDPHVPVFARPRWH
jgi:hypothetical protein